jgi:outer membrane protein assembly factor BamB
LRQSLNTALISILLSGLLSSCQGLQIDRSIKAGPTDWGTLGGSPSRVNQSASSANPPLREIWQYDAGSGIAAMPLARDNILVVCTLKGELHAVDLRTGKRIGYIAVDGAVTGTPVWNGTTVYIPISTEDETVESVNVHDGSRNWRAKLGQSESSPLLFDKCLYVTTLNGVLYCLNSANGDEIWKFQTETEDARKPIRSSPATDGDLIIFGSDNGVVYAVERASGIEKWRFKTGQSIFASPIITKQKVMVGSLDGRLYCLEIQTGKLVWSFDTKSKIFGSASTNDTLAFVGTTDGRCYALDVTNGSVVWTFDAKGVINSAPLVARNFLYVGSLDKNLYLLDIQTGKEIWRYEAQGRIKVSPIIWNGILLVTSEDNYVTALKSGG